MCLFIPISMSIQWKMVAVVCSLQLWIIYGFWWLKSKKRKNRVPNTIETKEKEFLSLPFITDQKSLANVEKRKKKQKTKLNVWIILVCSVLSLSGSSIQNQSTIENSKKNGEHKLQVVFGKISVLTHSTAFKTYKMSEIRAWRPSSYPPPRTNHFIQFHIYLTQDLFESPPRPKTMFNLINVISFQLSFISFHFISFHQLKATIRIDNWKINEFKFENKRKLFRYNDCARILKRNGSKIEKFFSLNEETGTATFVIQSICNLI